MNKKGLLIKTSELSGVALPDCDKVLNALEQVLTDKLESSKSARSIFDKLYKLMTILNNK